MNVIIAGEMSGIVRSAFEAKGHNAWSCDLLPTEIPSERHHQGDVFEFLKKTAGFWDIMIGHPPCTAICNSSQRWMSHPADKDKPANKRRVHPKYPNRQRDQVRGLNFFIDLWEQDIPKICLENPIPQGILNRCVGKYTQLIQPYEHGDPYTKATCLWLKGLPELKPTNIIPKHLRIAQCHHESPGPMRAINRSRTYPGVARSFAQAWG